MSCSEPVSYAAGEKDCTAGLIIEVFDDSDKFGAGVVLHYGCPQSCVQKPVEGLFEMYKHMVRGLAGAEDIPHKGFLG